MVLAKRAGPSDVPQTSLHNSTMKPLLLFDLGGVLVENDMFLELGRLTDHALDQTALKTKWLQSPVAREFELGLCSPETFSAAIVDEFFLSVTPQDFLTAFTQWPKPMSTDAISLLSNLRRRYPIGCLSNSNEVHWTTRIESHFDYAYSSHLLGRIKPDVEVLEFVTKDLARQPSDIVFFDDSALNVQAALDFGWDAHLTEGFDELNRALYGLELEGVQ